MGQRRDRLDGRLAKAKATREYNSLQKLKERERRQGQILTILKDGKLPYAPGVMSWLSEKLDKKASRITDADVQGLLA